MCDGGTMHSLCVDNLDTQLQVAIYASTYNVHVCTSGCRPCVGELGPYIYVLLWSLTTSSGSIKY